MDFQTLWFWRAIPCASVYSSNIHFPKRLQKPSLTIRKSTTLFRTQVATPWNPVWSPKLLSLPGWPLQLRLSPVCGTRSPIGCRLTSLCGADPLWACFWCFTHRCCRPPKPCVGSWHEHRPLVICELFVHARYIRQLLIWHNQIIPMTASSRSEGLLDSSSAPSYLHVFICFYSVVLSSHMSEQLYSFSTLFFNIYTELTYKLFFFFNDHHHHHHPLLALSVWCLYPKFGTCRLTNMTVKVFNSIFFFK